MTKQPTELFLARRIARQKGERSGAMTGIARVSVAICVTVMVVALSVIFGFKEALHNELTGLEAHISVEPAGSYYDLKAKSLTRSEEFEQTVAALPHFESITPFATHSGIVRNGGAMQGAMLRGVTEGYDSLYFASRLTDGTLPRIATADRKKDILLSATLARLLDVEVGDKVEYVFTSPESPIRRDSYKVCGIYSTGLATMEQGLTITDLRNVQRLNDWSEEQYSGYMVMADGVESMEQLTEDVRAEAFLAGGNELWRTTNLRSNYPQLFDWLSTHDINGTVIIAIMMVVALLNMMTALLIIIFERVRMIGTLKALGMRNRSVQKLFLWCGARVILVGQLVGNLVAGALILVQRYTGVIKLDPEAYLLDRVPVAIDWGWWLLLNIAIPVVLSLLLMVPVAITSRIRPDQTLKYQ